MMKNLLVLVTLAIFAVALVFAQENKPAVKKAESAKAPSQMTLKGYVVDAMCAKKMAGKETTMKKAAAHSKDCALNEDCAATGYGIFSDGKWYKFDETGDKQAKEMIEKSSREKGLSFEVTGMMSGETFAVNTMKEAKAVKADQKMEKKAAPKEEHKN